MQAIRTIAKDLLWVGASDRRLNLFENLFPVPEGVSYNAYVLLDEKTVLLDTVDQAVEPQFLENVAAALAGRALDYVIVNHMEPDHCATLASLLLRHPEAKVVGNAKTFQLIRQFFSLELGERAVVVKEGDTLSTGRHTLRFAFAPMVHWPEVMVTFDETDGTLFSADAFGTFGALAGCVLEEEVAFGPAQMAEARRYYANIVGKYGPQVQALLKKAAALPISRICPLHGPIWQGEAIAPFVAKYDTWSRYAPEETGVVIAYASMYGHTASAAYSAAARLAEAGVKNIAMHDLSVTDVSYVIADLFRFSHALLAAPTYNNGLYPKMQALLHDMQALNVQNRTVALIENGSWAPVAGKLMRAALEGMKDMRVLDETVTLRSAADADAAAALDRLVAALAASLQG